MINYFNAIWKFYARQINIVILFFNLVFFNVCLFNQLIRLVGRVFANGLGDLGSIPGRVIPKTLKIVLKTSLLITQQYKARIDGKVEQSRERSRALPLHPGVVAIEKGTFESPSTKVANITYFLLVYSNFPSYIFVMFHLHFCVFPVLAKQKSHILKIFR